RRAGPALGAGCRAPPAAHARSGRVPAALPGEAAPLPGGGPLRRRQPALRRGRSGGPRALRRVEVAIPGRPYPVLIGAGAITALARLVEGQVVIVQDLALPPLALLGAAVVKVPAGEDTRSWDVLRSNVRERGRHGRG